ncbi:delta-lactam-biosynthetic de-N-acetylase [Haloimpatiens sp. FM7330]|uniref:delta-lactam-biosynthetic de-N-acetylase n=1 Tax=Haloimpatiens sp. FM7330 TaxID=3298610 RepID=UPI00363DFD39
MKRKLIFFSAIACLLITFSACKNMKENSSKYNSTKAVSSNNIYKDESNTINTIYSEANNNSNDNTIKTNNNIKIKNKDNYDNNKNLKTITKDKNKTIKKIDKSKKFQQSNNTISSFNSLSQIEKNWYYVPRNDGITPRCDDKSLPLLKKYNGYYVGNTSSKIIYLTFDEGYENGYTSKILDILKSNNVKAAFFVTTPYIKDNKELVKRMAKEGHLVCNHSTHHPSMPSIKDIEKFNSEFSTCAKTFQDITGEDMPKFFRPPMGKYSEMSLKLTNDLGYKTIFWSFAYYDWEPSKQPSHEKGKKTILQRLHPGAIYLLHAVSKTNTEILDDVIKEIKNKDYTFKTLNELK